MVAIAKNKSGAEHRLKIIEGHLKKIRQMVEQRRYCVDILNQSLAVQRALKEVDALILENHFKRCVTDAVKNNNASKAYNELIKIFKLR